MKPFKDIHGPQRYPLTFSQVLPTGQSFFAHPMKYLNLLLDEFAQNLVQAFVVPRGCIPFYFGHHLSYSAVPSCMRLTFMI